MFETNVTLVGRLITPLGQHRFPDGTLKVTGRMVCTERRLDRATGEWADGQSLFVTVVCKRGLAENAFSSLRVGDPLVVHGRLYTREYEKDGRPQSITEVEAWSVGPDLHWCTVVITRKRSASAGSEHVETAPVDDPSDTSTVVSATNNGTDGRGVASMGEFDGDRLDLDDDPAHDTGSTSRPGQVRADEAAVGV